MARIWRKALMPCYYNCPHEYIVRERDLFYEGASWGCSERDFQFLKKTIATHGRATEVAASPRCSVVRRTVCLLAD